MKVSTPVAAPAQQPAASIAAAITRDDLMADLRDLGGPRVMGTPQARESAELIRSKVDQIGGGWNARVEALPLHNGMQLYNVVADRQGTLPDAQRKLVIAGAHKDTVHGSPGANDDGSGSVALLGVARALRDTPTAHDLRLVWFDGEEAGLLGAKAHVRANPDEAARTKVMIAAEMLGSPNGSPVLLFGPRADAANGAAVVGAAKRLGVELEVSADRPWGSDHNAYDDAGMQAMVLATTAPPGPRILREDPNYHSTNDRPDQLNQELLTRSAGLLAQSVHDMANDL